MLRALFLATSLAPALSGCLLIDGLGGGGADSPGTGPGNDPGPSTCVRTAACPPIDWLYSGPAAGELMQAEVTVAQYGACVDAGACTAPGSQAGCTWAERADRGTYPVNCVDAAQADGFCAWVGGRLPGESRWEAEASSSGARTYPWGDEAVSCERTVMLGCGDGPAPVCDRPMGTSASGLCDLSGNVREWTADVEGTGRACRGGGWRDDLAPALAATGRVVVPATTRSDDLGFRCVR